MLWQRPVFHFSRVVFLGLSHIQSWVQSHHKPNQDPLGSGPIDFRINACTAGSLRVMWTRKFPVGKHVFMDSWSICIHVTDGPQQPGRWVKSSVLHLHLVPCGCGGGYFLGWSFLCGCLSCIILLRDWMNTWKQKRSTTLSESLAIHFHYRRLTQLCT